MSILSTYLNELCDLCRHHVFVKAAREVQLAEVGPRFEMKREPSAR